MLAREWFGPAVALEAADRRASNHQRATLPPAIESEQDRYHGPFNRDSRREDFAVTAIKLDGKALAIQIQAEIADQVSRLKETRGIQPCLATVLVGEDPASQVYIRNKLAACERVGMISRHVTLPNTTTQAELLGALSELNADDSVHGILVQLPLPEQIDSMVVLDAIAPHKDVDAFHPHNVGLLSQGRPHFLPCTPHGVVQVLARHQITTAGKEVVIVGRSDIVGKPLALMLAQKDSHLGPEYANATVTLAHSRTANLADVTRRADILVAAIGKPEFIRGAMIKPSAVVIDVGINRIERGLVGDVHYAEACEVASAITPVPGGIGPLTVTMLLHNTLTAAS